ncbi:MAG: hypothetical protein J0I07_40040 [Myxococcales bacterium]|nr:hypothetical protein [Myxococcales bacterium]
MRSGFALACMSLVLAAAAACATSSDDESFLTPDASAPIPPPPPSVDADSGPVRDGAAPTFSPCSAAGWCITPLPDPDLTLKDIRPFEHRAFAIAESPAFGVKVLEWDDVGDKWAYIDDNSQNTYELSAYAGKIWAPNENELYYAVAPGVVYHGKRVAPGSPWAWTRSRLDDSRVVSNDKHDPGVAEYSNRYEAPPVKTTALGVWGTSESDVYAWYANTIFHLEKDGSGKDVWVIDHVLEDPDNPEDTFFVFNATGSGPDDVWFSVGRGRYDATGLFACPAAVRKSDEGYRRVLDHTINPQDTWSHYGDSCQPKPDALSFTTGIYIEALPELGFFPVPWPHGGWLSHIESAGPGSVVGISGGKYFAYLTTADGGSAQLNHTYVEVPASDVPTLSSVWIHDSEVWLSGWGLILRTGNEPAKWNTGLGLYPPDHHNPFDGATFSVSTTVLNGSPLDRPLQVRGTSNTNLWAIGPRYALHKTTP